MHIIINKKNLIYGNYKAKCALGKRGIDFKKKEGDLITPKGSYKIRFVLYRNDRVKKLQSKIRKIAIKKDMGWCNDPKSKNYNKLVKLPYDYSYEKLYRKDNCYDIVLVLNYNMNPIIKDRGSAIFIHVAKRNYKKTEGCIAIKKIDLLKVLRKINNNTKVKIEHQK